MTQNFRIEAARTADDFTVIGKLFEAYAASLPVDLAYQDFAAELSGLPGKYAPPHGILLLARGSDDEVLGCVGLRPLSDDYGEMKRLYVLPSARGLGLGRALAMAVIDTAKQAGYRELRLDTLPSMTEAQAMYEQLEFKPIPPYYSPAPHGTVFMSCQL